MGFASPSPQDVTISAVVITRNEAGRIRRCLDSLRWVDEIVVVDDMSTDATAVIAAEEYGAKILRHPLQDDYAAQRNRGMSAVTSAWILEMDADEVVAPEGPERIRFALNHAGEHNGFTVKRINCVFDRPLTHPGRCDGVRIVRRGRGRSVGRIHEQLQIDGPVGVTDAVIYHFNLTSLFQALEKNNIYSEEEVARFMRQTEPVDYRFIRRQLLWRTPKTFYKHYVKNKGYRDGPHGLIRAGLNTLGQMVFWLKVLERTLRDGSRPDVPPASSEGPDHAHERAVCR